MTTRHFRYLFSAIVILTGIILMLCGMNFYRALYLIIFGVLSMPAGMTGLQNKETPKGTKFWIRKILVNILMTMTALSLCNFLIANSIDGFTGIVIWLGVCIIGGIVVGTFDYFAHNSGGDEAEFEAKKKQQKEMEDLYDQLTEGKK